MSIVKDDLNAEQMESTVAIRPWTMPVRRVPWMGKSNSHPKNLKTFSFTRRRRSSALRALAKRAADARDAGEPEDPIDLDWYPSWVASHRSKLPLAVNSLLDHGRTRAVEDGFREVWDAVEQHARMTRDVSIDEIIDYLEETGVLLRQKQDRPGNAGAGADDIKDAQRLLVFALLGWQSMVYLPELNSHPTHMLAIQHDTEWPDSGLVFDRYTIASSADMSDRPLWVLLKCFGNLLPAHPSDLAVNGADVAAIETSKAAASWAALYPDQLNAYLLSTLMRVKFRWVDTLALHLDYDKSTRTLSLFSFPSICVAHLQARAILNMDNHDGASDAKPPAGGAIFAFSSLELHAVDPRADEDDIAHFLQEVLVSFRLLFGQSVKSRKVFREVYRQTEAPYHQPDTLLARLCSEKCSEVPMLPPDRSIYYAARDFPVLYRRIELLADELKGAKPTSLRDLINDRRDTLQFWTFWLISVFGGISIFMGIIQIILQVIQIAQAAGKI